MPFSFLWSKTVEFMWSFYVVVQKGSFPEGKDRPLKVKSSIGKIPERSTGVFGICYPSYSGDFTKEWVTGITETFWQEGEWKTTFGSEILLKNHVSAIFGTVSCILFYIRRRKCKEKSKVGYSEQFLQRYGNVIVTFDSNSVFFSFLLLLPYSTYAFSKLGCHLRPSFPSSWSNATDFPYIKWLQKLFTFQGENNPVFLCMFIYFHLSQFQKKNAMLVAISTRSCCLYLFLLWFQ